MHCVLQKPKKENFLDPDLPSDEKELTERIRGVGKQHADTRRRQETLAVNSPEFLELKADLDKMADLRDRLINQKTNVQAGTKIVSRLTATGRARQLVSDEEHRVSAFPTLHVDPSRFGCPCTVTVLMPSIQLY
jgi:hypothetical protein